MRKEGDRWEISKGEKWSERELRLQKNVGKGEKRRKRLEKRREESRLGGKGKLKEGEKENRDSQQRKGEKEIKKEEGVNICTLSILKRHKKCNKKINA